ncbi:hypothetical protein BU52_29840 [Streptomyces toyocaensis]|uniref:Uncharacterized protein n=1 Tax=Streptomyces toyocaensis TaxID=55952 RepID=A0A081XJ40_STRTO|nr:hypothetical protein BU52_29840 [Streptomyces toyocaensis]
MLWGVLALTLVWVGWQITPDMVGDGMDTQSVPCAEAMRFADRSGLPAGAHDATCMSLGRMDAAYDVDFRITRSRLDPWLASVYPDLRLTSDCSGFTHAADACGSLDLSPPADGGAAAVEVTVEYGERDTALVTSCPSTPELRWTAGLPRFPQHWHQFLQQWHQGPRIPPV